MNGRPELRIATEPGQHDEKCALIASYESDPGRWCQLGWTNHYRPASSYRVTTDPRYLGPGLVAVPTLPDVFGAYRERAEVKSLGADGKLCTSETVGLLGRRPVRAASIVSIGRR